MLSRVIAKTSGMFFETQCSMFLVNFFVTLISELNAPPGPSLANGAYTRCTVTKK